VAVGGHRGVPGAGLLALGGAQPEGVGLGAQHGRAAEHVGGVVGLQRGHRLGGDLGGFLQRVRGGVADQVHDAVAAAGAGLAGVAVEP
jgi:hypothetical protein